MEFHCSTSVGENFVIFKNQSSCDMSTIELKKLLHLEIDSTENSYFWSMKGMDANTKLVDGYFAMLQNMSAENKRALIARLTKSLKTEKAENPNGLEASFGAWEGEETAEELAAGIRNARTFTRKNEAFWKDTCSIQTSAFIISKVNLNWLTN